MVVSRVMPALLTRTSIFPNPDSAADIVLPSDMSATAPVALRSLATASTRSSSAMRCSLAPAAENRCAMPRPMPRLAPVMTAVLPVREMLMSPRLPRAAPDAEPRSAAWRKLPFRGWPGAGCRRGRAPRRCRTRSWRAATRAWWSGRREKPLPRHRESRR